MPTYYKKVLLPFTCESQSGLEKSERKRNLFTLWQEFHSQCQGQIQMNTLNIYRKSRRLFERLVALLLDSESDIESIISSIVIVDLAILTQDLHLMPSWTRFTASLTLLRNSGLWMCPSSKSNLARFSKAEKSMYVSNLIGQTRLEIENK